MKATAQDRDRQVLAELGVDIDCVGRLGVLLAGMGFRTVALLIGRGD